MSSGEIIEEKEHQIAQLKAENTQLREELDWLKRRIRPAKYRFIDFFVFPSF